MKLGIRVLGAGSIIAIAVIFLFSSKNIVYKIPFVNKPVLVISLPAQKLAENKPLEQKMLASKHQQIPISVPAQPAQPASAPVSPLRVLPPLMPEETPINLRTVVVLRCSFYNAATHNRIKAYGSGAIVSRDGYIITARHVVDMEYAYRVTGGRQGVKGYQFESCEAGMPPEGARTPTPQEIRAINPFTAIDFLPYRVEIALIPDEAGMSGAEHDFIDIALARIVGVTADAKTFFNIAMPAAFDFSLFSADQFPVAGAEVVSFGFPSGAPSYGSSFYVQGSVGVVEGIIGGDKQFKDQPIGIAARMEIIGGRSGSPVFLHGKIAGVVSSKENYTKNATVISVHPLLQMLHSKGLTIQ